LSNLLIWQYRGKPKAKATIVALQREADEVFKSALDLTKVLSIEDATGFALDLVGRHVGIGRELPMFIEKTYFGWYGDDSAAGWGIGEWYRYGSALRDKTLMDDDDYRFMIKAKILKNFQIADLADLIDSARYLLGEDVNIVDGYDMAMTVILPFNYLNSLKTYAIKYMDVLRRPVTVQYRFFQIDANKPFGWAHDPTAAGFNEGIWSRFVT